MEPNGSSQIPPLLPAVEALPSALALGPSMTQLPPPQTMKTLLIFSYTRTSLQHLPYQQHPPRREDAAQPSRHLKAPARPNPSMNFSSFKSRPVLFSAMSEPGSSDGSNAIFKRPLHFFKKVSSLNPLRAQIPQKLAKITQFDRKASSNSDPAYGSSLAQ